MPDIINMTITTPPAVNMTIATQVGASQSITGFGIKGDKGDAGDPATNLVASVAGKTGAVTLDKTDVGLSNVDNTSDANKPVSTVQQAALDGKATKLDIAQYSVPYRDVAGNGEPNTYMSVVQSNASGNSIARRTADGKIFTVAGTDNNHAINKAQMDTADALKVNKTGDTMTGDLTLRTLNVARTIDGPLSAITMIDTANNAAFVVDKYGRIKNSNDAASLTPGAMLDIRPGSASTPQMFLRAGVAPAAPASGNLWFDGTDYKAVNASYTATLNTTITGTGFPNGVVTAPVGSIYIDKATTNGASSWIKKSGTGNTGWQVLEGDTGWRKVVGWTSAGVITGTMPTNLNPVTGVAGGVFMRRVGSTVQFSVVAGVTTSTSVAGAIPDGFSGGQVPYPQVPISATSSGGSLVVRTLHAGLVTWTLSSITSGDQFAGAGPAYGSTASWLTTQGWPTTLPGVAA